MPVLESILAGVAVNLLKAVSNKTVKALKQLFSEDELKLVLEKAYLDFKKSIPKE
ncbi:MAG: hypothetical protein GTN82_43070, partial [Candidatus Aminicenantes bacterium]|nr:hypothetical protein [Candidatus Aminicenantes bacterium]NIN23561.1 hypothetical protein [Candidatus Aminicenantes bacterium]NIR12232.1 hypothetical protein [Candidatus Aminicenantes bacterium]